MVQPGSLLRLCKIVTNHGVGQTIFYRQFPAPNIVGHKEISYLHVSSIFRAGPSAIYLELHSALIILVDYIIHDIIPLSLQKCLTHSARYISPFTATTSSFVELHVLIFCLVNSEIGHLLPKVMGAPVWLCMFGGTSNKASIHQLIIFMSSACRFVLSCFVLWRKQTHLPRFFQSSLSGACTLVQRKEMARSRSGQVHFPRYSSWAMIQ